MLGSGYCGFAYLKPNGVRTKTKRHYLFVPVYRQISIGAISAIAKCKTVNSHLFVPSAIPNTDPVHCMQWPLYISQTGVK